MSTTVLVAPNFYTPLQVAAYNAGALAASKYKRFRDNPHITQFAGISEEQLAWSEGFTDWNEDNRH